MHDGIRVFNTEPLVEKLFLSKIYFILLKNSSILMIVNSFFFSQDKDADKVGSVAIAEMLDRSNLIAIVSGGNYPIIAPNSGKYFFVFLFMNEISSNYNDVSLLIILSADMG